MRRVEDIFGSFQIAPRQTPWVFISQGGETKVTVPFAFQSCVLTIDGAVQIPTSVDAVNGSYTVSGQDILFSDDTVQKHLKPEQQLYFLFDTAWGDIGSGGGGSGGNNGVMVERKFTTTGGETILDPKITFSSVLLFVDGVAKYPGEYFTVSGNKLVYTNPMPAGEEVYALFGIPSSSMSLYATQEDLTGVQANIDGLKTQLGTPWNGLVSDVYTYIDAVTSITSRAVPANINIVYTKKYSAASLSRSDIQLVRDPAEDNVLLATKTWVQNGAVNGKLLAFDNAGKAFRLNPINGQYSIESLGGGDGGDDTVLIELAQQLSVKPVQLVENKVYNYTRAVKHTGGRGWIGKNTTFRCTNATASVPFVTSLKTAQGADNDLVNGTSGVANAIWSGILIDTNYSDTTGVVGFQFAENTLDNWVKCRFVDVVFKNSKFDNLAMQNGCIELRFENCRFENAGEDSVTIRKTCERVVFENCTVDKTALVAHVSSGNAKFGDGIVVKAKFVTINNCTFKDVGNNIKGAGIANNAEDNDNVDQASYNKYTNNTFINCYGGMGIGTVNAGFIAAGQLIGDLIITGNEFINTQANAIGIRYVKNVQIRDCIINKQNLQGYHAVELINVVNVDAAATVVNASGGACTVTNCNGKVDIHANDVSKANALNSLVIGNCDGLKFTADLYLSGRTAMTVDSFSNGKIDVRLRGVTKAGLVGNIVSRSEINVAATSCGNNGVTMTALNNSVLRAEVYDAGTEADVTYVSARLVSGSRNRVFVTSTSGQTNRPSYDILVEAGVSNGALYSDCSAGKTGKVNILTGATITQFENL
ncbi:hypothetical protein HWB92_gp040 [Serratia phage vB_SmaA_3M]|uniref:Tail fiber protein n=1 Tax=Serratia phage vB_SmaA_3M TaxID=2419930 RepID=A0A3G2YS31_9CAUD|nr:hypothetical protein HWB92_gp040 [Serratia phage vB_SmaA_3M]AYP28298.1 hypothetical protein 3M_042 [Serratia phage vB_SmaA_3M]